MQVKSDKVQLEGSRAELQPLINLLRHVRTRPVESWVSLTGAYQSLTAPLMAESAAVCFMNKSKQTVTAD